MTGVLADFVSTLRESLCLTTSQVEIRCDNTAAIVLATGEGSWKTKAAANKVAAIRERVEQGEFKISYVGTKEQCADSLTKFLRGGPDQQKAREQLSLISLEHCISGRVTHAKTCGLHKSFRETGTFGPRVSRVFCPPAGLLSSELSGPGPVGPFSFVRRKKRLCQLENKENLMNYVAISASSKKVSFLCEPFYRDLTRTAYKCSIMVRPFVPTEPKEEDVEMPQAGEDELPDFENDSLEPLTDADVQAKYKFPTWDKVHEALVSVIKATDIHPVDPICIACKVTPIPIKDLDPNDWLNKICLLYTSPSPRDRQKSRMPSSA